MGATQRLRARPAPSSTVQNCVGAGARLLSSYEIGGSFVMLDFGLIRGTCCLSFFFLSLLCTFKCLSILESLGRSARHSLQMNTQFGLPVRSFLTYHFTQSFLGSPPFSTSIISLSRSAARGPDVSLSYISIRSLLPPFKLFMSPSLELSSDSDCCSNCSVFFVLGSV